MSELFLQIVNMSISASWLVLAVLLLRLVLKKAPKWVSVLLWGFVALRLVCPISFESIFSLIPSAETVSPGIMMDRTPEISTGISSLDAVVNPFITQSFAPQPYASANPLQILIPVFGNLWVLGMLVMLAYTAVSYILLRRKVATAVRLQENIYQSENVASPFVLGIFKPRIYLPFAMDGSAQYVIAHEQAHIRRKDHWWKPLGFVLLALHWFNPLMWLGYILLCRDIELACDEKVIRQMGSEEKADYSQALLSCSVSRRSIAACPLAFGEVGVKARVKSVLNYKKPAFWIVVTAILLCAAVAVCFLTDPMSNTLRNIEFEDLGEAKQEEVWVSNGQWHTSAGTVSAELIQELYDLPISNQEISQSRSEDRDKSNTVILVNTKLQKPEQSYLVGMYIHFNADFTEVWVEDGVKPTLSYRVLQPQRAEALYDRIRSGAGAVPVETIIGNLQTYYKNADGTWQCNGYQYKYRLELKGQMPNAEAASTFVYLSNREAITFDQAWLSAGFSSELSAYFPPEEAVIVDWQSGIKLPEQEIMGADGIPAVQATEYLSGQQVRLLSFNYRCDKPGHTVIACGIGPWEGNYDEHSTLVLDGKMGQNQILLTPAGANLTHYRIYLPDGTVYDDGQRKIYDSLSSREMQTADGICLIAPAEKGEYIYEVGLSWPEQELTVSYGLKVVMTGEENGYDRALQSVFAAYGEGNPQITATLVDHYTLANSTYRSERYLFRVDNVPGAPVWVEVDDESGHIFGQREDPGQWLICPPYLRGFTTKME